MKLIDYSIFLIIIDELRIVNHKSSVEYKFVNQNLEAVFTNKLRHMLDTAPSHTIKKGYGDFKALSGGLRYKLGIIDMFTEYKTSK